MKRAIVIGAGTIDDNFALSLLYSLGVVSGGALVEDDRHLPGCLWLNVTESKDSFSRPFIVAADKGLTFLDKYDILPDLIVGDFDSAPPGFIEKYKSLHPEEPVRSYSWEKDYTDSEIAAVASAECGCGIVDFIGATGTRLDHVLGAINVLSLLRDRGVEGRIIDSTNLVTIHDKPFFLKRNEQWGKYVSLFPWGGIVRGLTLSGFHFPLEGGTLTGSGTLAVSNQIEEETASVSFTSGKLVMIQSKDRP